MPENEGASSDAPSATPGAAPQTPPPSDAPTPPGGDIANPEAQKYAREAAEMRAELRKTQAKLAEYDKAAKAAADAQLSEVERATKQRDEALAQVNAYKQRTANLTVEREAQKLGIVDPELAALAIASKLEYDDDGLPKNAEKLLATLLKDKPYLAGQPSAASNASRANPGRDAQTPAGPTFRMSQLEDFAFYTANEAAIKQAMREGRIIQDQ